MLRLRRFPQPLSSDRSVCNVVGSTSLSSTTSVYNGQSVELTRHEFGLRFSSLSYQFRRSTSVIRLWTIGGERLAVVAQVGCPDRCARVF
jgi:hypothetical protein